MATAAASYLLQLFDPPYTPFCSFSP